MDAKVPPVPCGAAHGLVFTRAGYELLRGSEISFTLNGVAYSGRVNGDTMDGTAKGRTTRAWTAVRTG